jgi:copper(I)-binding protein
MAVAGCTSAGLWTARRMSDAAQQWAALAWGHCGAPGSLGAKFIPSSLHQPVSIAMTAMTLLLAAVAGLLIQPLPLAALPLQAASKLGVAPPWPTGIMAEAAADQVYKVGELVIEAPWTRATPGGAKVGGAYLKITNTGAETDRLIGGSLPTATAVEVHAMSMTDGVMKMRKLQEGLEIKPGQTVELKPGGYHLMFIGLSQALQQGHPVKGALQFEKAGSVEVEYRVAPIGARSGEDGKKEQHVH